MFISFYAIFHRNAENCTPLLIQENVDGSTYFNRPWQTFKFGLGSKFGNYWLGNELLHHLTKDGLYKLRFDLQALGNGQWYWAEYSMFIVDSEATKYRLTVGGYSGNAGDAMSHHNGMKFTTFDDDNDSHGGANCAVMLRGGFWYKSCAYAHINTGYGGICNGFGWYQLPTTNKQLQTSRGWLVCP